MKKQFLCVTFAVLGMQTYSQTLLSDNFESYNTGPLGSQGGWLQNGSVGTNDDFSVTNLDTAHGKSLHLTYVGENVYGIYQPIDWNSRTGGNDILSMEYETYLPSYSHSLMQILGAGGAQILIRLWAGEPQFTVGRASYTLNTNTPSNNWYKIAFTYNANDGNAYIKIGNNSFGPFTNTSGIIPERAYFLSRGGDDTGGVAFDNILISAKNTTTLSTANLSKIKFGIYPNPTADFITVEDSSKGSMTGFTYKIFDYTGKLILTGTSKPDHKIDIQKLSKGNYILQIEDRAGKISTEKFTKNSEL
ncbi:T9SS type A sorting domain-containing protein [Chryseobacterium vrystaatense]|uniref:Por secretion system C-terminal sorting domain-containing protein n=1 Tax=Chryseobacterium vrystaatense TaxID=307480 RepID=A0A1M5AIG1_9FLAO|nr:T9SS type A sorting domain-containing protein [Chryseobacterium vrystaatense]SHF30110.1 Por secretion system C-terminal sorting domain-containing protein [Chryseobacterium vrystaatense]